MLLLYTYFQRQTLWISISIFIWIWKEKDTSSTQQKSVNFIYSRNLINNGINCRCIKLNTTNCKDTSKIMPRKTNFRIYCHFKNEKRIFIDINVSFAYSSIFKSPYKSGIVEHNNKKKKKALVLILLIPF